MYHLVNKRKSSLFDIFYACDFTEMARHTPDKVSPCSFLGPATTSFVNVGCLAFLVLLALIYIDERNRLEL